jgi:hypothetical protein
MNVTVTQVTQERDNALFKAPSKNALKEGKEDKCGGS